MSQDRYSVIRTNDCIVIEGPLPVDDLCALLPAWQKYRDEDEPDWIVDSLLSGYLGVNMVVGPPDACADWRDQLGIAPVGPPRPAHIPAGQPDALEARYRLVTGPYDGIVCLQCGRTSYNSNDVARRFCGHCGEFLED